MHIYTYILTFKNDFGIKQALFLVHIGMYYLLTSDLSEHNVIICFKPLMTTTHLSLLTILGFFTPGFSAQLEPGLKNLRELSD